MLVGRDVECRRITEALGQVRAGRGAVLLLTGPPGVGKTALTEYAAGAAEGLTVLRATASLDLTNCAASAEPKQRRGGRHRGNPGAPMRFAGDR